jgi:type IV secretion system protein VirB11
MATPVDQYLKPLLAHLVKDDVTELCINGAGGFYLEQRGSWVWVDEPQLITPAKLETLSSLIVAPTGGQVDAHSPFFSGTLPEGQRIEILSPPAVHGGCIAMSIRKPAVKQYTLNDYATMGAFDLIGKTKTNDSLKIELIKLRDAGKIQELLELAVKEKQTIVISGGTSSGKTTFFNTLVNLVPSHERLISIEDAQEIKFTQKNYLHLIKCEAASFIDLLKSCLRLRPDRIFAAELRGEEAYSFLRAVKSGHSGSMTTLHANTPKDAFDQLNLMVSQAGLGLDNNTIDNYIHSAIDMVIQFQRTANGERGITEIYIKD